MPTDWRGLPAERLEGEETLFEQDGIRVETEVNGRRHMVTGSFVRVTNRRILVGTGSTKKPRTAIVRYAILLDSKEHGGGPLQDGYVTFPVRRDDVTFDDVVRIPAEGAAFEIPRFVAIHRARIEALRAAIVDKARPPVEEGAYR